jgi:hypothetical protein
MRGGRRRKPNGPRFGADRNVQELIYPVVCTADTAKAAQDIAGQTLHDMAGLRRTGEITYRMYGGPHVLEVLAVLRAHGEAGANYLELERTAISLGDDAVMILASCPSKATTR